VPEEEEETPSPTRKKSFYEAIFGKSSPSLYLSVEELDDIEERQRLRDQSIKYVLDYIYYGVPCKIKGIINTSPSKKGGGKEESLPSDPDMTFITIDRQEVARNKQEVNGVVDTSTDIVTVDLDDEYGFYPEACSVCKTGDILISIRGEQVQRKIIGKALDHLREAPTEPNRPYIVGTEVDKITIGWEATDEGTGLVDQYHIEYKEVGRHDDSEWKVAVVKEWAREDDLLHVLDHLMPCSSYAFRMKCRNRCGWSPYSRASDVATTDAAPPDTPNKVFASKVTPDMVHLHWHAPRDNGARITCYVLRGKRVGGIWQEIYSGGSDSYVVADVEGGNKYIYEVRALNSCGKSNFSQAFTITVPLIVDPNAQIDVSEELRKGHLWLECWDQRDERNFWFHTITGNRQLTPPPEWSEYKNNLKLEKARNAHMKGDEKKGDGADEDVDPVVRFRMKRFKFFKELREWNRAPKDRTKMIDIKIRRTHLFSDTLVLFSHYTRADLLKKPKIIFSGEDGIDSGGLTKDWFLALSRSLSVDVQKIFKAASNGNLEIHQKSEATPKQLERFKFAGMILGKALYERQFLDMPFTKIMYKLILGLDVGIDDLKEVDETLHKSLCWMMDNDVTDVIYETFSVTIVDPITKKSEEMPLCEDGENRDVTEENKGEYVKLVGEWRTHFSVMQQLESFKQGLNVLVPDKLLKQFTIQELELLFNGKKNIDSDEIRAYTIYQGKIDGSSKIVLWFWQLLRDMDVEDKMKVLKFVTGSDRVPLDGFHPPFNITDGEDMTGDMLPRAHTCFNQIVLPRYKAYRVMREKIKVAIDNTEGFDLS